MIENLEGEEWKDIVGYEGLYMVSNLGRVKSLKYGKERILKPKTRNAYGYQSVQLYKNNVRAKKQVHRLVGEAFLSNPENKPCIDHIDTNPRNNCVDNLRWVSHKENSQNPLTIEHHIHKFIYCFETDIIYQSIKDATKQLNLNPSNVSKCCRGLRNHVGGYHFCYTTDKKEDEF